MRARSARPAPATRRTIVLKGEGFDMRLEERRVGEEGRYWRDWSSDVCSSDLLTANYTPESLAGKLVLGVVNLPPRRIGPFTSEVLTLGVPGENGECVLVAPDRPVPLGVQLY